MLRASLCHRSRFLAHFFCRCFCLHCLIACGGSRLRSFSILNFCRRCLLGSRRCLGAFCLRGCGCCRLRRLILARLHLDHSIGDCCCRIRCRCRLNICCLDSGCTCALLRLCLRPLHLSCLLCGLVVIHFHLRRLDTGPYDLVRCCRLGVRASALRAACTGAVPALSALSALGRGPRLSAARGIRSCSAAGV